jgi:hypothetical protein
MSQDSSNDLLENPYGRELWRKPTIQERTMSGNSVNVQTQKPVNTNDPGIEGRIYECLKAISDETSQLNTYLTREKRVITELCDLLTKIISRLRTTFEIQPSQIPRLGQAVSIRLDLEGRLVLNRGDGRIDSKPLREYSSEVVLTVLWLIIGKLQKSIQDHQEKISRRASLLDKIKLELESLHRSLLKTENEKHEQTRGDVHARVIESHGEKNKILIMGENNG